MAGVAALAALVRSGSISASGGYSAVLGYDDGVYFAAAHALVHGLQPYTDFVLLHPPGILLIGAGPVWIGDRIGLTDAESLALVRGVYVALGALNTVLVYLAGRHLSRVAGVSAALLYAVWLPAVRVERSILLEPIVAVAALTALVLIPPVTNRQISGWWRPVVAGIVGGIAIGTKLWAVVPVVVIALALVAVRRWRTSVAYLASSLAVLTALLTPFVVSAGSRVWEMVVVSQMGRPPMGDGRVQRLALVLGFDADPMARLIDSAPPPGLMEVAIRDPFLGTEHARLVVSILAAALAVLSVVVAVKLPVARVWVLLLTVQVAVLVAVPTFFVGYAAFAAPALTLVAGAGVHLGWTALGRLDRVGARRVLAVGAVAVLGAGLAALAAGSSTAPFGRPFDPAVREAVAGARCVASDSPSDLALSDSLSTNVVNGCDPVIDFTGMVYLMDHPTQGPITTSELRLRTPAFQSFARAYFAAADHVILRRWLISGLDEQTMQSLKGRPRVHPAGPRVYGPRAGGLPTPAQVLDLSAQ